MMHALALSPSALAAFGGSGRNRSPWMWATGTLNVAGYVQNSKTFNLTSWMWLYGRLLVFGVVDNSKVF